MPNRDAAMSPEASVEVASCWSAAAAGPAVGSRWLLLAVERRGFWFPLPSPVGTRLKCTTSACRRWIVWQKPVHGPFLVAQTTAPAPNRVTYFSICRS